MPKKLTQEEFIQRGMLKHDNLYTYEKVDYKNISTNVYIYCKKCMKYFSISPSNFLNRGCSNCNREKRKLTTDKFIKRAIEIHGDKYNYAKSNCTGSREKLIIICNKCNREFPQIADSHLQGKGCKFCNHKMKTTESFIQEYIDKYPINCIDFSKTIYISYNHKVIVRCVKHDIEWGILPLNLMRNQGCKKCHYEKSGKSQRSNTKEFILKVNGKFPNHKFDLTNVVYKYAKTSINVTCLVCGHKWKPVPDKILAGRGCPKCNRINYSWKKLKKSQYDDPCVVYYLRFTHPITGELFYKIGHSINHKDRMRRMSKIYDIELIQLVEGKRIDMITLEESYHKQYAEYSYYPKESIGGGETECYSIDVLGLN